MAKSTINIVASIGGITVQGVVERDAEGQISQDPSLPPADKGILTTRASDTAGTITMDSAEHSIETGDKIDIFWDDAGTLKCAKNATVGTVAGTSVPFTLATGDALPALDTVVWADEIVVINTDFDGDDVESILLVSSRPGHYDFVDSTPTSLHEDKLAANEPWFWFNGMGYSNPLTGNPVDALWITNGDYLNAAAVKLGVHYQSVP